MPAGLQGDAAQLGGPKGRAGSNPAQSNLVAEFHPANTLSRPRIELKLKKMTEEIEAGQVWAFSATKDVPPILVFIGSIESLRGHQIVGVQIKPHPDVDKTAWPQVGHLPILLATAEITKGRLVRREIVLGDDFREGYAIWLKKYLAEEANAFSCAVTEAYALAVEIRNEAIQNAKNLRK